MSEWASKAIEGRNSKSFHQKVRAELFRFYGEGVVEDDFKFWMGLGKKKFLGMNFTSMF